MRGEQINWPRSEASYRDTYVHTFRFRRLHAVNFFSGATDCFCFFHRGPPIRAASKIFVSETFISVGPSHAAIKRISVIPNLKTESVKTVELDAGYRWLLTQFVPRGSPITFIAINLG